MWNLNNLKNKELYEWYQKQDNPKAKRSVFASRVLRYWYSKEESLNPESIQKEWKRKRYWTIIKENWRVCSRCKKFKIREEFARTRYWINWRTCNCKECRNEMKAEYRKRTQYAKDHEYKKNKRNLKEWDQIYFQNDIREVIWYKTKKWYTVKSVLNGVLKQISTSDNHYKPNNHCVRFRKLWSILKVKTNEQIQKEKELEEEKAVNLSLFD